MHADQRKRVDLGWVGSVVGMNRDMGTNVDDYDPWQAAAVLYRQAETADRLARIRRTVASTLRKLADVPSRPWPDGRATKLERDADRAGRYASMLRIRAERLAGCKPWRI
jgi:acetyl-CoA carboxylase alpha subunit